jgi:hypothetical protein
MASTISPIEPLALGFIALEVSPFSPEQESSNKENRDNKQN